jgi:hypothetical protein
MLKRISHQKFGLGVVLAERKSESGKLVSVVVFDNCPNEEKVLLSEFLQESKVRMPQSSKKAKRKSPPKAKPEPVSDELLVPVQVPCVHSWHHRSSSVGPVAKELYPLY